MSTHRATVEWTRGGPFARKQFQRAHRWSFDGGLSVPAAASPEVVPLPQTRADAIDPEEAFVAAISSCHMMTFLFHAANDGLVVESYADHAEGQLREAHAALSEADHVRAVWLKDLAVIGLGKGGL
jgi:organic hydroperoxide reductase OsmC/OhrA